MGWKITDRNTNRTTKNNKDYQHKCKKLPTIKKKFWDKYNKYKLRLTAESAYNPSAPQKIKALDLFGCLIGTLCRFSNQDQYLFRSYQKGWCVKSCESDPNEVEIVAAVLTDGAVTGGLNIPIHLKVW